MANLTLTDLSVGAKQLVEGEYIWKVADGATPGILDKLLSVVNDNIGIQYDNGRIKDDKYADVYLGAMQTVIAQSIQYLLQEKTVEVQIDATNKDIEVKERSILLQESELADKLLTSDKQRISIDKDIEVKERSILLQESELADKLLTSDKQRISIDKDIEVKERNTLLQESELADKLLTSDKQRLLIAEEIDTANRQQALLTVQEQVEQYKLASMLPLEIEKVKLSIIPSTLR